MLGRQPPKNILDSYQKKRRMMPTVIGILAGLLVVIGIFIIVLWLTGGGLNFNLFSREPTPTGTMPPTPVLSPTPSLVPTETLTPTLTVSPTPSEAFAYEVKENETCWEIATRFEVDLEALLAENNFEGGQCPIYAGQIIEIPAPGTTLPTITPIPPDQPPGTIIDYTVRTGDSLLTIASFYNTTVEDIIARNDFYDPNNIAPGTVIKVRVGLVTPTPTFAPTSTPAS